MFAMRLTCNVRAGAMALGFLCGLAPALAQVPPPGPIVQDDAATMQRAAALYYSSSKAGLKGFDCDVHPDWRTIFLFANNNKISAEQEQRIALLASVSVKLHARLDGSSTMDWTPPPASDASSDPDRAKLLETMHGSVWQTIGGFLQFWTPFFDGSTIPNNTAGSDVTHTDTGFTLHSKTGDTEVTEVFATNLLLQQFNVITGGQDVRFQPFYQQTAQGLLVNRFLARMRPVSAPASQDQEMRVAVQYATVHGFPIPSHLDMELVGSGVLNMDLTGCSVVR